MGGLAFLALRPWLADAGRWKGLLFGVLILAMALAYVLLALPLASVTCARATGRFQRLSDLRQRPAVMGTLIAVVAPPVMVGLFLDVRAIADIF